MKLIDENGIFWLSDLFLKLTIAAYLINKFIEIRYIALYYYS